MRFSATRPCAPSSTRSRAWIRTTVSPPCSGVDFFDSLERQYSQRAAIMSILYDRRQKKPYRPSLSVRNLDNMIDMSPDEMSFALWYLKQRGLVRSDDKSNLQITVDGMDFLEARQPAAETVLPFIKASAVAPSAKPAKAGQAGAPMKPVAISRPDPVAKPDPISKSQPEASRTPRQGKKPNRF